MNLRKFYFIISITISVFLFITGSLILGYLKVYSSDDLLFGDGQNKVNELLKPFVTEKTPFNTLVLVGDQFEANTDTILLVNFNPSTNSINIMSIPRDMKVNISGLKIPKVNSLYSKKNGENLLIDAVSNMLNIDIKYYIYFNISTFKEIIDMLGGIYIDVPVDMDYDDPIQDLHIHLKKGYQHMDGEKAEQFLRFRHPNGNRYSEEMLKYYNGSDTKRIESQQYFIKELIKQKANILYLPRFNDIINVVYQNMETNVTMNEVLKIVKSTSQFSLDNVSMFKMPGESKKENGIWYIFINKTQALEITSQYFNTVK